MMERVPPWMVSGLAGADLVERPLRSTVLICVTATLKWNLQAQEITVKIYTLGYSGWSVEAIKTFLESVNGVVVDVRMVPRSRHAPFNGTSFSRLLGDRYYWLSDFGNVNYKNGGPITIANFDKGVERLVPVKATGKAVVLLCGCADINTCHRKVLAERLAERWGAEVVHITPPPKVKTSPVSQLPKSLF